MDYLHGPEKYPVESGLVFDFSLIDFNNQIETQFYLIEENDGEQTKRIFYKRYYSPRNSNKDELIEKDKKWLWLDDKIRLMDMDTVADLLSEKQED